jgi:hypothetical protein
VLTAEKAQAKALSAVVDTARVDRLPRAHKGPARDAPCRPVQILAVMGLSRDVLSHRRHGLDGLRRGVNISTSYLRVSVCVCMCVWSLSLSLSLSRARALSL